MTWLYVLCLAILVISSVVVMFRVEKGPSMLDRAVSVDIITAGLVGFTAIFSVLMDRTDLLSIIVALALVGFLSTVTVARFAANESDVDHHILTREELEALGEENERLADDAAPVHDVDALAEAELAEAELAAGEDGHEVAPSFDPDAIEQAPDHATIIRKEGEQ
ncbi:MAG: monovalent cation/H+ antiporter complex subunit F [bacterium]|nr:monovalent cation/H+ antiporter complex subunit F [bacterium]